MKRTLWGIFLLGLPVIPLWSADSASTQNKNITILTGQVSPDGKTEVRERLLEECIVALPPAAALEPMISSDAKFLKEIGGDPGRNDFMKTYSAVIEVSYLVHQKVLFIVTSNAVPATPPVMKEIEKSVRETRQFVSSATSGDLFAGRSRREYFHSTPEGAVFDARKKAEAWLRQQSAVVCGKGPVK